MNLKEIVLKNRSYRRFYEDQRIEHQTLIDLIDLARSTPSGRNVQPIKYKAVSDITTCSQVFELIAWAGYFTAGAPLPGERPSAYILICNDTRLAADSKWDQGIVSQTILLQSVALGLGGCIIGSIRKRELSELFELAPELEPMLVLAIGVPKEQIVLTSVKSDGDIKYFRDEQQIHYVPKRSLDEVLIK